MLSVMKNQVFYYRFTDTDGKIAIGQVKLTELKSSLERTFFNRQNDRLVFANLTEVKAIAAPLSKEISFNEITNIYPTFEDAVNRTNTLIKVSFGIGGKHCLTLLNPNGIINDTLQDIWDTMPENLDLKKCEFEVRYRLQPIGYVWEGSEARMKNFEWLGYDFIKHSSFVMNEQGLDSFYYSKEACKADNPIKCYTF